MAPRCCFRRSSYRHTGRLAVLVLTATLMARGVRTQGAETGDFDGDGRLTIADCAFVQDGRVPAPGSTDRFLEDVCHDDEISRSWVVDWQTAATYFETLRRAFADSLPNWVAVWPVSSREDPLPELPEVIIEWDEAAPLTFQGRDRVVLRLKVVLLEAVRAFSIVVEPEDQVLRVAPTIFSKEDWYQLRHPIATEVETEGDLPMRTYPGSFLITNGRYVLTNGLDRGGSRVRLLSPGTYSVTARGRIAGGTPPGSYEFSILDASEAVLDADRRVGRARVPEDGRSASLRIPRTVEGWDEGIPPLKIDPERRAVDGAVEFRVLGGEGHPGDAIDVIVQIRTEIPLNSIRYWVNWSKEYLLCNAEDFPVHEERATPLLTNEEDGRVYQWSRGSLRCGDSDPSTGGVHRIAIGLEGSRSSGDFNYPNRPLEYFRVPFGKWLDLTAIHFRISPDAPGGHVIPLRLVVPRTSTFDSDRPPGRIDGNGFQPYSSFPCLVDRVVDTEYWQHETPILHHGEIRVLGDQEPPPPPPPPPDLGFRADLGNASGLPGDPIEIPVFLSLRDTPAGRLDLVFELDPAALVVESFAYDMFRPMTGETLRQELPVGEGQAFSECEEPGVPETCTLGVPWAVSVHATEPQYLAISMLPSGDLLEHPTDYPGPDLRRIGSIIARIREDFAGASTRIEPSEAPGLAFGDPPLRTAAYPADLSFVSPSLLATGGTVTIGGRGFRRGDANADGNLDLSDAVGTLGFLFLGASPPGCEDAADTDDSGAIDVTDPIALLGHLFLGGREPAVPFPECGEDPTDDDLICGTTSCD